MNVAQVMLDLQECLCGKIEEKAAADEHYQGVCECSVMWSAITMLDHCGPEVSCGDSCGQAWVRFVSVNPDPSVDPRAMRCTMAFQVTLEVGIGRCSATGDNSQLELALPSSDDYLSDMLVGAQDMDAITQAVMCCGQRHRGNQLTITSMSPFGPEGGCFGTFATVTMQVLV